MASQGIGGIGTAVIDGGFQQNQSVPTNGFSYTCPDGAWHVLLSPAGTLATGTITLPQAKLDGQLFDIRSTQNITTVTWAGQGGQTIAGAPTGLTAYQSVNAIYQSSTTSWIFG